MISKIGKNRNLHGIKPAGCSRSFKKFRKKFGFTLVEVMLAVVILGIGVVSVLKSYTMTVTVLGLVDSTMTSVCWLKDKMTEIENELVMNGVLEERTEKGYFEENNGTFEWKVEIRDVDIDEENLAENVVERLEEIRLFIQNQNPRVNKEYAAAGYAREPVPEEE